MTPSSRHASTMILASIAMTGAAVLIIEVLATRILAPFFGSTIFSVSGILTVILAALALGYKAGGKIADQDPTTRRFFTIILQGGLATLIGAILAIVVLPSFGQWFDILTGPLAWASVLFFAPAFLLGMLSPLAIVLAEHGAQHAGTRVGSVFFWSTLGSLMGSLGTAFVLVPLLGVRLTFVATGVALLLLGVAGMTKEKARIPPRTILLATILLIGALVALRVAASGAVFAMDGTYGELVVRDTTLHGTHIRMLEQDKSASSAIDRDTGALTFAYTKYHVLSKVFSPTATHALVIGGGSYTIPDAMLKENPKLTRLDVAEVDPALLGIGKKFFGVSDDPRLVNHVTDGRRFLKESEDASYDVIIGDAYSSLYSIPEHMATKEYFALVAQKLSPDGVFIGNFIGRLSPGSDSFLLREYQGLRDSFPTVLLFAVNDPNATGPQNFILVASKKPRPDLTRPEITNNANPIVAHLADHEVIFPSFQVFPAAFTDDKSGVTLASARILTDPTPPLFDRTIGDRALALIKDQVALGARNPTAPGHAALQTLIEHTITENGGDVRIARFRHTNTDGSTVMLANIIGRWNPTASRRILLGAHYDTRAFADRDNNTPGMPGANDGASGTAVLLAMMRSFKLNEPTIGVDVVFFDAEEGEEGASEGTETASQPIGAQAFVDTIPALYGNVLPERGIVVDMVCAKNAVFPIEKDSLLAAPAATERLWAVGARMGAAYFTTTPKYRIIDDHTYLTKAGIPSILMIDIDYPAYHTMRDLPDQCSSETLSVVGNTLLGFLSMQ